MTTPGIDGVLRAEADAVIGQLAAARKLLRDGRPPQIAAAAGRLNGLCHRIAALPREEGRRYRAVLESTYAALDALEADLRALRERAAADEDAASPGTG